ncbi:unnamed protein product [Schistosoma turkestanicum]|nr:unnamed protein product [Schistosoma turkestanicum]
MLDELSHRVNWKDNNTHTTIRNDLTSFTTSFHETPKKRFKADSSSECWTNLEDCKLLDHVSRLGENRWNLIGKKLGKSAFQCSERYLKHLRPQMFKSSKTYTTLIQHNNNHNHHVLPQTIPNTQLINSSTWTNEEDSTLFQLYLTYGSNWELIANRLTTTTNNHAGGSGLCKQKRTAIDVRKRYEKIILQYNWPISNQENRPLSSLLFRNSLLSWSNSSKNNSSTHNNNNINTNNSGTNNARPTYVIPLSSLKSTNNNNNNSNNNNNESTTNGNWTIRLTQSTHHHDSGFNESGLSNSGTQQLSSSVGSNSQQSLSYSIVTTSISSQNSLLSTSTPVDLIKTTPLLPSPDKSQSNLPLSSASLLIKSNSLPKLLESNSIIINDLINSSNSLHSPKLTSSPSLILNQSSLSSSTNHHDSLHILIADNDDDDDDDQNNITDHHHHHQQRQPQQQHQSQPSQNHHHHQHQHQHQHQFVIQTPTKALSEADQLSFHLTSPPAVLGSAGRYATTTNVNNHYKLLDLDKTPIGSRFQQCSRLDGDGVPEAAAPPLRRPLCTRLFDNIPNDHSLPSTTTPSSSFQTENSNHHHHHNGRKNFSTKTNYPTLSSSSTYHSYDEAKCIAILTAKATVWNRALLPISSTASSSTFTSTSSSMSTLQRSHYSTYPPPASTAAAVNRFKDDHNSNNNNSSQSSWNTAASSSHGVNWSMYKKDNKLIDDNLMKSSLKPLKFSKRKQPHFILRRIVQIANENDWQEVAYSHNSTVQTLIQSAKLFLKHHSEQQQHQPANNEFIQNLTSPNSSFSSPLLSPHPPTTTTTASTRSSIESIDDHSSASAAAVIVAVGQNESMMA